MKKAFIIVALIMSISPILIPLTLYAKAIRMPRKLMDKIAGHCRDLLIRIHI